MVAILVIFDFGWKDVMTARGLADEWSIAPPPQRAATAARGRGHRLARSRRADRGVASARRTWGSTTPFEHVERGAGPWR
jgi:hypothetical protein